LEHIHADPHWREDIAQALEGRSFDLAVAIYGRLRYVAENLRGKTPRLISVGGALPVYKGWMAITEANPWEHMEPTPLPLEEDHPLSRAGGVDHFSLQIRRSEQSVMQAHREGHYNATHFRYPIVYGPRHIGPPEWAIIRRVRDGRRQIIVPGGGMVLLSRGFADNIADGIMLAIDNPTISAGQIYNICDDRVLYNREWVGLLSQILRHEFELIEMPFDLLPKGFRATPTQLLFRYHRVMDTRKIKEQLGYHDTMPVEKALETTVRWYMDNPLPPGGEIEQNIGDPFDYEYEDKLIQIYKAHCKAIESEFSHVPGIRVTWRHPYPHPQKRGDHR
jgi:nucleoside-diphosphate-sugar epimerase